MKRVLKILALVVAVSVITLIALLANQPDSGLVSRRSEFVGKLFVVVVSAPWIHAATLTTRQGTQRPSFEDFRVTQVFRGRPVPPVLDTPKARAFRTELRRQAASGPNFAGHFTVALWAVVRAAPTSLSSTRDRGKCGSRRSPTRTHGRMAALSVRTRRILSCRANSSSFEVTSTAKSDCTITAGTIASSLCCRSMNTVGTGREFECYQQAAVSNVP